MIVTKIYFFVRTFVIQGIACAVIALSGAPGSAAAEGTATSE